MDRLNFLSVPIKFFTRMKKNSTKSLRYSRQIESLHISVLLRKRGRNLLVNMLFTM